MNVAATHTAQGVRVVSIDDYEGVDISPAAASYVLAVRTLTARDDRQDRALLGGWEVNINYMSVAAGRDRRALMVLGTGRPLTESELGEVASIEDVFGARQVDLS